MKNRVAKLVDIGKVEIFSQEVEPLKEGELLVNIKSSGICGSDMHYFIHGGLGSFKQKMPMFIGHEPSGIIVDSNNSKKFNDGDRVAVEPGNPCLDSFWSKRGKHNLCEKGTFMGATAQGSFSDYVVVSEEQLVTIPDSMSYETAALLEPIGVALHCYNLMNVKMTDTVCILGAGSLGHSMRMICEKSGIKKIFMIEKEKYRVDFAKSLGVEAFLSGEDSVKSVKKLTDEFGATCVIDTAGNSDSINCCISSSAVSGKMGLIGIPDEDYIEYNPHKARIKEMRMFNVRRSNQTLHDCVSLFSGDNSPEKIITHRYSLEKIQEAFDLVANKSDDVVKCMINNT